MEGGISMKLRFYYAHYSSYGVKTIWAVDGKITGSVFAFRSKKRMGRLCRKTHVGQLP